MTRLAQRLWLGEQRVRDEEGAVRGGGVSSSVQLHRSKSCSLAYWCEHRVLSIACQPTKRVKKQCPGWVGYLHMLWAFLLRRTLWPMIFWAVVMPCRAFLLSTVQLGYRLVMQYVMIDSMVHL